MELNLGILFGILAAGLLVYMSLWFAFAFYVKRIDVVDVAWGLGFVYVAIISLFSVANSHLLQTFALILTIIWGGRLSAHIAMRLAARSEGKRYQVYREKWGDAFWQNVYLRIFILQGLLILAISTPVVAVLSSTRTDFSVLAIIGLAVWIVGILVEAVADWQLGRFARTRKTKNDVMQSGLWRFSRHPNYFGEITTWLGAALVAGSVGRWWGFIGFVVITLLITKVSGIPLLEKHYAKNKAYQTYTKKTSILIPWLPKKVVK